MHHSTASLAHTPYSNYFPPLPPSVDTKSPPTKLFLEAAQNQVGNSEALRAEQGEKMNLKLKAMFVSLSLLAFTASSIAMPRFQDQQTAPDNTRANKDQSAPTADDQSMNPADREIVQKIRKSIHADDSLSMYAQNIKIISQDGKVTLRGPVRSVDDKKSIQAKAVAVAGKGNVTNLLKIAPPSN
jgi:hyperosmotically inducible periplasmic protein